MLKVPHPEMYQLLGSTIIRVGKGLILHEKRGLRF